MIDSEGKPHFPLPPFPSPNPFHVFFRFPTQVSPPTRPVVRRSLLQKRPAFRRSENRSQQYPKEGNCICRHCSNMQNGWLTFVSFSSRRPRLKPGPKVGVSLEPIMLQLLKGASTGLCPPVFYSFSAMQRDDAFLASKRNVKMQGLESEVAYKCNSLPGPTLINCSACFFAAVRYRRRSPAWRRRGVAQNSEIPRKNFPHKRNTPW